MGGDGEGERTGKGGKGSGSGNVEEWSARDTVESNSKSYTYMYIRH